MHQNAEELLTIGVDGLRARWSWTPGSRSVVIVVQTTSRLGPGSVAFISVLRERSRSWLRLGLLIRGERALHNHPAQIRLLGERVLQGMNWLRAQSYTGQTKIGLFGEGQGAAVALLVARQQPSAVAALVLCSGQFDFAENDLSRIQAPTLLIAAGMDRPVLESNRQALNQLRCSRRLEVVPNAMRNLAQPGALDTAAHLAAGWFESQLRNGRSP